MQRVSPARSANAAPPPPPKHIVKNKEIQGFREVFEALGKGTGKSREEPETLGQPPAALPVAVERDPSGGDTSRDGSEPFPEPEAALAESELALEPMVDPMLRALAPSAPRLMPPAEPATPPVNAPLPELEQLLGRLVRRAAFGGDGRKGTARLEIGAGALSGATLLVHAEGGELSIDLELPPGAAPEEWRARITSRLEARGLTLRELTVR